MTAHTDRNSARPQIRMAMLLPGPGRKWLLNVAALLTGVVGGLTLAPDSARAQGTQCAFFNSAPSKVICIVNGDLPGLSLWDVEALYNFGIMDMRNGETNDLLSITGESAIPLGDPPFPTSFFGSGTFYGGNKSRLAIDTHVGADGDPDNASDILALGGNIRGHTEVIVNNVNRRPVGFNRKGIPIVVYGHDNDGFVASISKPCGDVACVEGDAFFISDHSPNYFEMGGVPGLENGLFFSFMAQDDDQFDNAGAFELRTVGGPGAINAPRLLTGLQDFWYNTDEVVQDHSFAYNVTGGAPAAAGSNTGLWAKGTGSWVERDTTTSSGGIRVDNGSHQDIYSILGGADMKPGGDDSKWRLGVFGGYGTSHLDLDLGSDKVEYEGGIVGGYAAYSNGAFYADATVKGDILSIDYSFDGVSTDADGYNIGVRLNTGYRFAMGSGFIEPLASFAYVHSDVDNMTGGGGTVNFSDGESVRLGGGARAGVDMGMVELSLLGRLWNEFEGSNTVTVTDGFGNTSSFTDNIEGLLAEVTARITVGSEAGWSGFLEGGGTWGANDLAAYSAKGGVRYSY